MTYQAPATPPAAPTGERVAPTLAKLNGADASQEMLEMAKFFITANSKAPEQNLFNLPRMAIWPISSDPTKRTRFDKLAYFCANIKNTDPTKEFPIILQRQNPLNGTDDYTKIPNNPRLYQYLTNLTNRASQVLTPRAGAAPKSFATKHGVDQPQILTEIFDYIRCTNLIDTSDPSAPNSPYTDPTITGDTDATGGVPTLSAGSSNRGLVVPLVIGAGANATRGLGRVPTISELAIAFHKKTDLMSNGLSVYDAVTYNAGGPPLWNGVTFPSLPKDYPTTFGPVKTVAQQTAAGNPFTCDLTPYINMGKTWPRFIKPANQALVKPTNTPAMTTWDWKTKYCFEAMLMPNLFCPMAGYPTMANNIRINFSNFNLMVGTDVDAATNIFTAGGATQPDLYDNGRMTSGSSKIGGSLGPYPLIEAPSSAAPRNAGSRTTAGSGAPAGNQSTEDSAPPNAEFIVSRTATKLTLSGSVTVKIYVPYNSPQPIQTLTFTFPATTINIDKWEEPWKPVKPNGTDDLSRPQDSYNNKVPNNWTDVGSPLSPAGSKAYPPSIENEWMVGGTGSRVKGSRMWTANANNILNIGALTSLWGPYNCFGSPGNNLGPSAWYSNGAPYVYTWIAPNCRQDYVRSSTLVAKEATDGANLNGDIRVIAARDTVTSAFGGIAASRYGPGSSNIHIQHSMIGPGSNRWAGTTSGSLMVNPKFPTYNLPNADGVTLGSDLDVVWRPYMPTGTTSANNSLGQRGDWDNGPACINDGPYANKADEGAPRGFGGSGVTATGLSYTNNFYELAAPYIGLLQGTRIWGGQNNTFFSPNRIISSPVMLGSLPTGVKRGLPWQTLLFRPAKSYLPGGSTHPGSDLTGPPDHLLLDLFWMPVVEPYAISEPFSTAGKVNLNNQVVPFTNIKRNTGLHAVLKPVKITAINPFQTEKNGALMFTNYKNSGTWGLQSGTAGIAGYSGTGTGGPQDGGGWDVSVRRNLDVDNTIRQITDRLAKNQPFLSASEICDIPLIPADMAKQLSNPGFVPITGPESLMSPAPTLLSSFDAKLQTFWNDHLMTGDNSLERPYSSIYPRLTTRSNTYTVHVRVQTLSKAKGGANTPTVFDETKNPVASEFRGAFVLERYLDPNTGGFVNAAGAPTTETDANAVLGPYRFRVISSKQFAQ